MSNTIVARTALGPIKGLCSENLWNTKYLSFFKVPYAKPPTGGRRFKDPEPSEPWSEVLDCTEESPGCSQKMMFLESFQGEEDCLHLSVFTRNTDPRKLQPVMVFIHGGGFVCGSNATQVYGPDFLIEKDVVLVTINYRLGALGFLSLNDPTLNVPGNAGLKDQVLALKWVRENISYFGGNPNCVTVFGESAGGASVHYLLISELARGLFHRAIVQSGSVFNHWALPIDRDAPGRIAKALGWNGNGGEAAILEILMKADHMDIVKAQEELITPDVKKQGSISQVGPTIEPYFSEQCMIPRHPREMCRTAWGNFIPIMVGATSEEGLLFYEDIKKNTQGKEGVHSLRDCVPLDLNLNTSSAERKRIADKLREFYFAKNTSREENIASYVKVRVLIRYNLLIKVFNFFFSIFQLFSDKDFWHGISRLVRTRCENTFKVPTFLYRFNYNSPNLAFVKSFCCTDPVPGICHGDELGFLFKNSFIEKPITKGSSDHKGIDLMVNIWTSFAKTGNPNCDATRPELWHPVAVTGPPFRCLNINENKLEFCQLPETERMALWDSFYTRQSLT
ncbi:esterase B1-like isoform X1 [Lutzomyia longipalpis]|uniref:esterase B1-like isoform X1 n=1 Tax=Lutzomyia longipalpis TaxID=7200 RepID=UPI0024836A91|nr:esterase B1-like isoform X1 [Lutzomyia longipalpis]